MTTIDRIRESFHHDLKIEGILLTMYDDRTTLARQVAENLKDFFRGEVLQRWADLSLEDVVVLNGKRDELMGLLQERYGLSSKRAGMEVDDFLGQLQERIRIATDITENPEAGRHILKIPA